jgi:hypothetical protein
MRSVPFWSCPLLIRRTEYSPKEESAAETVEIGLSAEPAAASAAERVERGLQNLRSLLLGFDVDPHDRKRVLSAYLAARAELGGRFGSCTRPASTRCSRPRASAWCSLLRRPLE